MTIDPFLPIPPSPLASPFPYLRPDTRETIHKAMEFGVDVKMITGDHLLIAKVSLIPRPPLISGPCQYDYGRPPAHRRVLSPLTWPTLAQYSLT